MASGVAYFSTNTDLGLVNALNQSLNLYLPLNAPNGKSLFIKDANGNSFKSTITVLTQGSDTFEDGSVQQIINSPYESIQLAYTTTSNKWYITGGTMFNTMNVSTLRTQAISSINISSLTTTFSTLTTVDQRLQSTVGTINSVSSFLFYNSTMVSAGLRFAPSQILNRFTFSPIALPGLSLWVDSSDRTSFVTSGTSVTRVFDKSQNNVVLSGTTGFTYNPSANLFNTSYPSFYNPTALNNATLGFNTSLSINTPMTIFFVGLKLTTGTGYLCDAGPTSTGVFTTRPYLYLGNANTQMGNAGATNILTTNALISLTFSQPGSLFNNGSNVYSGSVTISPVAGFMLGNRYTLNESWDGNFCEFMLFNNALNTLQRQQMEGYLAWKWGLQSNLIASHPYKNAPP